MDMNNFNVLRTFALLLKRTEIAFACWPRLLFVYFLRI